MTGLAIFDVRANSIQRLGESQGIVFMLFHEVKDQSQCRLLANAGKLGNFIYCIFDKF